MPPQLLEPVMICPKRARPVRFRHSFSAPGRSVCAASRSRSGERLGNWFQRFPLLTLV